MSGAHDPWTRWYAGIAAALLILLAVLIILSALRGPSVNERLSDIEQHLTFQSCLLLIPQEERGEAAVSECVAPELGP